MPTQTPFTRENIARLFTFPTEVRYGKLCLKDVNLWVWHGTAHEDIRPQPGSKVNAWWEKMTLKLNCVITYPDANFVEIRHKGETVWSQAIRAGSRRSFTVSIEFAAPKVKVAHLPA